MRRYVSPDDTVPLTEDDEACLLHIYRRRLRLLKSAFGILAVLATLCSHPWALTSEDYYPVTYHRSGRYGTGPVTWVETSPVTHNGFIFLMLLFWALVLGLSAFFVYRRRILPYIRDAKGGFKMVLFHTITGKQHFEHVGQYFLLLDNPDCMNEEVNAETYYYAQPGDRWPVYFAPRSGYAFNARGRFTLM